MERQLATLPRLDLPARAWRASRWALRRATQRWRQLPDFIIIGAPRTGTTSLYRALRQHRHIGASFSKEVHFFDGRTDRGIEWYRANFPLRVGSGAGRAAGEATPNYFAYPDAPQSIAEALPEVRLIALLRDPIERTHSAWRLKTHYGEEERSFSDAIRSEADQTVRFADRRTWTDRRPGAGFFYLEKSRYAEHLERWFEVFPRQRMLIVKSEELFSDPHRGMAEILEFIGVDPSAAPTLPHIHATPSADIDAADRQWLENYFAPYNRKLADLTGIAFG